MVLYFWFDVACVLQLPSDKRSTFSRVYGYSLLGIIFFHVAVNICMTIGLAPVIGITNNTMIDKSLLIIDNIEFNKLPINKDLYANISASYINIQNLKIKQYNNDGSYVLWKFITKNSNLEDFRIHYTNQGRKELINKNGEQIFILLYYSPS